jgi:hypothetical protein
MDPSTMMMLMNMMQGQQGGQGQGMPGQGGQGQQMGGMQFGGPKQFINGLFGRSGSPYQKGMNEYQNYFNQGMDTQKPFYEAGKSAIPQYQEWLNGQKDPSKFINNLMGGYQESPYAKFQQQQAMRAGQNSGSANGLLGSTPLMQQMQENASNISSGDMNNWMSQVLGINTQYGNGLNNQMQSGQHAADQMSNMYQNAGDWMGNAAYGREFGHQQDRSNIINGLFG